ncbi:MAG: hypothetical protein RIQ89_37 [Bacteroidota bacterium]|jgi:hypothetical protein
MISRIFIERISEPLHLNILTFFVALFGTYKQKILFDLILRHCHAFALNDAANKAKEMGLSAITVIEFGVAEGGGLLNICKICEKLSKIYNINFQIVGFDTGEGMPMPLDYRDHPELYQPGDFKMNPEILRPLLPNNCELILGHVSTTLKEFCKRTSLYKAPIAFISFDLDYYSSTYNAFDILQMESAKYLPTLPLYFDDIALSSHNSKCGELLAIQQFNSAIEKRVIEKNTFLPGRRIYKHAQWIDQIFYLHVLDHPIREELVTGREIAMLGNPYLD